MPFVTLICLLFLLACGVAIAAAEDLVLVYTRNGKGYVHENISRSVEAIRELGKAGGFAVEHSDDAGVFTPEKLKLYRVIVFSNSNNEAFENDDQRQAFQGFIRSGGGLVGIHIATGSERKWPYWWSVMGGRFVRHPKLQKFTVQVKDRSHPSTKHLPDRFEWEDECYYMDQLSPRMNVLLVTDPAKLEDAKKGEYPAHQFGPVIPLAWYQTVDGGRQFYTSLGHKKEHYSEPLFRQHLLGGILWTLGKAAGL